jgi:hypothetical protein
MRSTRLIGAAAVVAGGLLLTTAPAHAVVDPAVALGCLLTGAADLTMMIEPTAVSEPATLIPAEVPLVHCATAP